MADDTTKIERDLAEYGVSGSFWASLDSSDTFKLSAHSSQTAKFSNIQTVSKLELILSHLYHRVGVVVRAEEDVLWLEVAVADVLAVEVLDRGQQLVEVDLRLSLRQPRLLDDLVEELAALRQLEHDVEHSVGGLDDVLQPDHARVVDAAQQADLQEGEFTGQDPRFE